MLRCFLAIRPADDVIAELASLQAELEAVGADARWVPRESLHATLRFIGDVRDPELPAIEAALVESFRSQPPLVVACTGLGVFPNWKRPRVLWAGLRAERLADLADRAETALSPLGFPPEDREFAPHVTLARIRTPRNWPELAERIRAGGDRPFGETRLDHVTLFHSDLRHERPVYRELATIVLGGATDAAGDR